MKMDSKSQRAAILLRLSVVLSLVLSLGISNLQAQNQSWAPKNQQAWNDTLLSRMTRELKLTQDQQNKVKTVLNNRSEQWQKMRQNMMDLRQETKKKLENVLSKDQIAGLQKMIDQRKMFFHYWMMDRDHHWGMRSEHRKVNHHRSRENGMMHNKNTRMNSDAWVYMALARMTQRLNLNSKQQDQVKNILQDAVKQFQKNWEDMKKQRQSNQQQMLDILNKDQIGAFQKMKDRMMYNRMKRFHNYRQEHRHSGMKGYKSKTWRSQHGAGTMMDQWAQRLNLTPQQKEKVQNIFAQHLKKMRTLIQQRRNGAVNDLRAQISKARQELNDQLKSVLSKDQMEQYNKMQEEWHNRMMNFRQGR